MTLSNCNIHIELPEVSSLKGRRAVLNSIKEKLKSFNVSILDISGEYAKEGDIAFVYLSPDSRSAAQYREKIEAMVERNFGEYHFEIDHEEL